MSARAGGRARPELVSPTGFDELLPSSAGEFVPLQRMVLDAADPQAARRILDARRRHLSTGSGPMLIDLPAADRPAGHVAATRVREVVAGEILDRITIEPVRTGFEPDTGVADHWSLDLDHDRLVHRAMLTGDGMPPDRIDGVVAAHDAARIIALRIVGSDGAVVAGETVVPAADW